MRRSRALLARLIPVAMLTSLLAMVGGAAAQADPVPPTNWAPVTIGSDLPGASDVMTDPSGGVTVGCPQDSTSTLFQSFDNGGTKVQDQSNANGYSGSFCPDSSGNATVGKDGTVYPGVSSGSSQYIQAWKNNSLVWTYSIPCGSNGYPWAMTMGADDNLYVVIAQGSGSCYGWQLIGLTPTAQSGTSPAAPQVVMNHPIYAGSVYGGGLAAYDDGLVMYTNGGIQYVPYTGTWPDVITPSGPLLTTQVGQVSRWFEATTSGRVYVVNKASAGQVLTCSDQNSRAGGITAIDPDGTMTTAPLYGCTTVHEIHPMPSGGFAMRYAYSDSSTGWNDVERISAGSWYQQIGLPASPGADVISVDLNGDVVLRVNQAVTQQVNGSSYRFPEITVSVLSGFTGEIISSAQFALRGDSTTSGPSYMWTSGGNLALARNTVYVAAYQCATLYSGCNMANTTLYAFTVPGVQMDYPRGAILQHDDPWKSYVAMGDSFSSGEGVEPFVSGTNTTGSNSNVCHRSEGAYAELLNGIPGARLDLTGFRACSGARTDQITGTWPNVGSNPPNLGEHAQDEALSSTTNVVTVSIGGNDVGFADFVKLCLFADCNDSAVSQSFFDAVSNLGGTLSATYDDILTKASNATVYVVGYPQIMPDPSSCSNPLGAGITAFNSLVQDAHNAVPGVSDTVVAIGELAGVPSTLINDLINAGQVTFTTGEMTAGRNLTAALNSKISATVSAVANPRLKFVDATAVGSPFAGHELCTSDPYFNGLDVVNQSYSFHPNKLGQDAYRQLVLLQL